MTTTDDILPRWLSTKETAFKVALWLMRQPDRTLHHMRILAELAEVTGDIRDALLKPPWQTRPGAHLEAAWRDQYLVSQPRQVKGKGQVFARGAKR